MSGNFIPVGQKRLTNVAIVRLKSHGKRFEIACYKNKVLNWREGIEKDLQEVIQTDQIFENVSQGTFAKTKDLKAAFNTTDFETICKQILKTGDLQVSDKEREVHTEGIFKDVVNFIVERCVHPQSGRQLTPHTVENALRSIGFSVKPDKPAKKQALDGIKALCEKLPDSFARAKMRLRITCPLELASEIRDALVSTHSAEVEEESKDNDSSVCALTFVCDPSHYRQLDELATKTHAGRGVSVQIVTATVLNDSADILSSVQAPRANEGVPFIAPPATANASLSQATNTTDTSGYSSSTKQQTVPTTDASITGTCKPKGMRCSTCDASFEDVSQYRPHCKSEWHNFNLKRKVKSMPPVSEEEFKEISLDTKEGFIACD